MLWRKDGYKKRRGIWIKNLLCYLKNSGGEIENETWQEFSQIKLQLDNLELERARVVIIKYKAQWIEGEKNTSIFFRSLKWETMQ